MDESELKEYWKRAYSKVGEGRVFRHTEAATVPFPATMCRAIDPFSDYTKRIRGEEKNETKEKHGGKMSFGLLNRARWYLAVIIKRPLIFHRISRVWRAPVCLSSSGVQGRARSGVSL